MTSRGNGPRAHRRRAWQPATPDRGPRHPGQRDPGYRGPGRPGAESCHRLVVGRSAAGYVLVFYAAREAREIFTGTDQCHQQDPNAARPAAGLHTCTGRTTGSRAEHAPRVRDGWAVLVGRRTSSYADGARLVPVVLCAAGRGLRRRWRAVPAPAWLSCRRVWARVSDRAGDWESPRAPWCLWRDKGQQMARGGMRWCRVAEAGAERPCRGGTGGRVLRLCAGRLSAGSVLWPYRSGLAALIEEGRRAAVRRASIDDGVR